MKMEHQERNCTQVRAGARLAAVLMATARVAAAAEPAAPAVTITDQGVAVWERYDPRADDLEIELVSQTSTGGVAVARLYFTSHRIGGRPVRLYGIYARPATVTGRVPGLLFIHGGGQVADEPEVIGMARQGYAAFSHEWEKPTRPDQTDRPSRWVFDDQGVRLPAADEYLDSPAWLARRALTVLERQPEVDPDRLGVYGFSWGGHHTWALAATESRLKVAHASCGLIWSASPSAADVRVPMLFMDAANDFFARLDTAQAHMRAVKVEQRQVLAPNENHNLAGTGWEATRLKWFDHYLRGGPPLAPAPVFAPAPVEDGGTQATVRAPGATSCRLLYSYGTNAAPDRCWFGSPMAKQSPDDYEAALPLRAGLDLWCFANAEYADGTTLSTACHMLKAGTGEPAAPAAHARWLYDPIEDGICPWYFSWKGPVADHPWHSWGGTTLAVEGDVEGRPALLVRAGLLPGTNSLACFRAFLRSPACPLRASDGATALRLAVLGDRPLRLTVVAHAAGIWTADNAHAFRAVVDVADGQRWAEVAIPVAAFSRQNPQTKAPEVLRTFDGVQQFHVTVESANPVGGRPALGRIEWVR